MSIWGDIGSFAAGGPIGYGIYKAVSGGGDETIDIRTPEQIRAQSELLKIGLNGSTPYSGSLGDFALTELEKSGLSQVSANLGTVPKTLDEFLNSDKYNPLAAGGVYDQLQGGIDRSIRDATSAAKRSAAYTGNLYSTDAIRTLGDVQAKGVETKASTMAGLFDNYIGRRLSAVPLANQIQNQNLSNAFTYGALPRNLNTARDQAAYSEFQRQQSEKTSALNALSGLSPQQITTPKENPWMDVLQALAQFGGRAVGAYAAA